MSGISSSVGLISGLPTEDIINQLMLIESLPLFRLQNRVFGLEAQRTAINDLLSSVLGIQTSIEQFSELSLFRSFNATSSDDTILTATADEDASPGVISFRVHSLVTNHQLISVGMPDSNTTPVGLGTLTMEIGNGSLNPTTELDALNGGAGVRGGVIQITDRSGDSAEVDLSAALTVDDVLDAINSAGGIEVHARVSGDQFIIEDQTGLADEDLTIEDLSGGFAALDLGIAQSAAADEDEIVGSDVFNLVDTTSLSKLNDGNGIRIGKVGTDLKITVADSDGNEVSAFDISLSGRLDINGQNSLAVLNSGQGIREGTIRITDRSGASAEVDLTDVNTVQDVLDAINSSGVAITATVDAAGTALNLTDTSGIDDESAGPIKIEDVDGFAAADLGIDGEHHSDSFLGDSIYRITTLGDAMRAINYAFDQNGVVNGEQVVAKIADDGNSLVLSTILPPLFTIEVTNGDEESNGRAATDLGIIGTFNELAETETMYGSQILAGMNTVLLGSLNGGSGVENGTISFTNRNGITTDIDLGTLDENGQLELQTVADLIEAINATTYDADGQLNSGIQASINHATNGIAITDVTGGLGNLVIADADGGTMAADLGIVGESAESTINGGNAQLQYVSEATLLSEFNHNTGVRNGTFEITTADGAVHSVNVTDSQQTVFDVMDLINSSGGGDVTASINANGDGILITDNTAAEDGDGTLKIEDVDGGFTARDLNIDGETAEGVATLDGSFEIQIQIDADDTLENVATKIKNSGADVATSIINDGSSTDPYLLTLSSTVSGLAGEIIFDAGDTGLAMNTLVSPQDAVVFLGGAGGNAAIAIRSSTNTLTEVLGGVTIDLLSASDEEVTLSIAQDVDSIVNEISSFVASYNSTLDLMDDQTSFDSETFEKGILFGDTTVNRVRDRLYRAVTDEFDGAPEMTDRLFEIGVAIGEGVRLEFDDAKFREVYAGDPDAVEVLFTLQDSGVGDALEAALEDLTDSIDGLIPAKDGLLGAQIDLLNLEIERTEDLLEIKRAQLEAEFVGLETTLAGLQGQASALLALDTLLASLPAIG
ncbi:MAG: flagellar filament capping protein FliD [Planctomycetes bacterium]|nr:flagellar filament capping protein FliD [Planctomycetota bacterium]